MALHSMWDKLSKVNVPYPRMGIPHMLKIKPGTAERSSSTTSPPAGSNTHPFDATDH